MAAHAVNPLKTGEYVSEGGMGRLSITDGGQSGLRFEIHTIGPNRHSCDLGGNIAGNIGRATSDGFPSCVVVFEEDATAIQVRVGDQAKDNFENCRNYCGMRAGFDGTYWTLPPDCGGTEKRRTLGRYASLYQAGQYAAALQVLRSFQASCEKFLDVTSELDRVHNDVAITLHHLGDDKACLQELAKTMAASADSEEDLRQGMAGEPANFELYLPVAKSTWFNQKLCKGRDAK